MKTLKPVACAAMLVLTLSTATFAKTGTIGATKSGTIGATRNGTIGATRNGTIGATRSGTIGATRNTSDSAIGIIPTASDVESIKLGLFEFLMALHIW